MIKYRDQIHRDTIIKLLKKLDKISANGKVDIEYLTALYIICYDDELRQKCVPYVQFGLDRGIEFDKCLKKQDFSEGYRVLVRLASNLFNENNSVTPMELIYLSGEFWELALRAIILRKSGPLYENDL